MADEEYSEEWCTKWYNLLNCTYMPEMDGKHKEREVSVQQELVKRTQTHTHTQTILNSFYLITAKCLSNISWNRSCQTAKLIEEQGAFINSIFVFFIIQMNKWVLSSPNDPFWCLILLMIKLHRIGCFAFYQLFRIYKQLVLLRWIKEMYLHFTVTFHE